MPGYTVLWDLDGTLVDSSALHAEAFVRVLGERWQRDFDYSRFTGWRTEDVFAAFGFDERAVATLTRDKRAFVSRHIERIRPFASATATVAELQRLGCEQVIVTGASRERAATLLERFGWATTMEIAVAADTPVESKPSSAGYRYAMSVRRAELGRALVVEDSVATAENAGLDGFAAVFLVTHGACGRRATTGHEDISGVIRTDTLSSVVDWVTSRGAGL